MDFRMRLIRIAAVCQRHSLPTFDKPFRPLSPCHTVGFQHGAQREFHLLVIHVAKPFNASLTSFSRLSKSGFP